MQFAFHNLFVWSCICCAYATPKLFMNVLIVSVLYLRICRFGCVFVNATSINEMFLMLLLLLLLLELMNVIIKCY